MELESVTLKLPRDLLSGAQRVATARDVTIGHMVRQLLKREVERQLAGEKGAGPDPRLLVALQALLAHDIAEARDWLDLAVRLRPHGYEMRPENGDVALFKASCGTRVCKGAEIGAGHDALASRFGGPMPAHLTCAKSEMPAGRIDPTRRAMLSGHIASARNWPDLIHRLALEGLELRPMGAGIAIYVAATGRHLCNAATVGANYKTLVKRFGAAMPNHPHDMTRFLPSDADDSDDLELVERG